MGSPAPVEAPLVLAWMSAHGDRLRAAMADEGAADGGAAAGDGSIRAHLRFVAEALEAVAGPPAASRLAGLADALPEWFAEGNDLVSDHLARGAGAIALEEHLQFGARPGSDPSLDAGLDRRLRLGAWTRLFLLGVEDRLGPAADGVAEATMVAMSGRSRDLAGFIIGIDRRLRSAAGLPGRSAASDAVLLDEIGQAAVVQAHMRVLVEALAAALRPG